MKIKKSRKEKNNFNWKSFVNAVLIEDVGIGDHTSLSTIPVKSKGTMKLLVKENGILAGIEAATKIISHIDKRLSIEVFIKDGAKVKTGDIAFQLKGPVHKLLIAERLLLNIMQRMSGIATHTNELMQLCKGTKTKVIDTRKTTPGFRFFEKWAVRIGGGENHRFGLYDMILIKDNHIDFAGGIEKAVEAAFKYKLKNKLSIPIEVEVRSFDDISKILKYKSIDRIMLDNFSPSQTKKAVQLINKRFKIESSGGINSKNIRSYAKCGVDYISIGALTHQVKSLDLSLKAIDF